jgi:hypothetical protein
MIKQKRWSYFANFNRKFFNEKDFNRIAQECLESDYHVIDFSDYIKILYNPNQRVDVRIYKKSAR